jgi:hypothetical protein
MKSVFVNRFDNGRAESKTSRGVGEFAESRHFDIFTYPNRLTPLRGVEADETAGTQIGMMIVGSDGLVYGLGKDSGNNNPEVYKKADSGTAWDDVANTLPGGTPFYSVFAEYQSFFYFIASGRYLVKMATNGSGTGNNTTFLDLTSVTTATQAVLHPKDDILYVGYNNKIATVNASVGTAAALTLPSYLTITSIAPYGNMLAIAAVPTTALTAGPGGGGYSSVVYLWDRDTSLTTVTESIDWGTGLLRVINVLDGVLIGFSESVFSTTEIRERDSVIIKGYTGSVPFLIKEISTNRQTTTSPNVLINPRVNFVYRNKLYVSLNIVGGSTSPTFYGLWCVAKSKTSDRYIVFLERQATNDASDTGVFAAAAVGDIFYTAHTALGTSTRTNNDNHAADHSTAFSATSLYESLVNPGMNEADYFRSKKLGGVACYYTPLLAGGSVTVKYRVDSSGDWTTVFTDSTDGSTGFETNVPSSDQFTDGRFYEFRIESTGNAEILGFAYKYSVKTALV